MRLLITDFVFKFSSAPLSLSFLCGVLLFLLEFIFHLFWSLSFWKLPSIGYDSSAVHSYLRVKHLITSHVQRCLSQKVSSENSPDVHTCRSCLLGWFSDEPSNILHRGHRLGCQSSLSQWGKRPQEPYCFICRLSLNSSFPYSSNPSVSSTCLHMYLDFKSGASWAQNHHHFVR